MNISKFFHWTVQSKKGLWTLVISKLHFICSGNLNYKGLFIHIINKIDFFYDQK